MSGIEVDKTSVDLIQTINSDDEIEEVFEEDDSDAEIEYQPTKWKRQQKELLDKDCKLFTSLTDYNVDSWTAIIKQSKKGEKKKSKTDDKIIKARTDMKITESEKIETKQESDDNTSTDNDSELSDDEMVHDNIKDRKRKGIKQAHETLNTDLPADDFFEDIDVADQKESFYEMNLSRPLMKAITAMGFLHPTPIQSATIPVALLGRDICGCAATGTGKTAAYMLPTLERLLFRPASEMVTRVLVLVPTRELGVQVFQVTKQLCQYTNIQIGLSVGGLEVKLQESVLRNNPDIVIGTPGRLIDHLKNTPSFSLNSIEVLILDEADRMLDEYFELQMKEIIEQCSPKRQTMLFSATMSEEVRNLALISLSEPVRIFVDSNKQVAFNLRQEFIKIKYEQDREAVLAALVVRTFKARCIIFVQTKMTAHRLHILLGLLGIKIAELHGDLSQSQRLEALKNFKNEEVDVLVATDVAARGLDIPGVKTVINFMMPPTLEHYIHRVGRTARAGKVGVSVSLASFNERKMIKEIVKRATNPVKSRIIPIDVMKKYKEKLKKLEIKIQEIFEEEKTEKILNKAENRLNRFSTVKNKESKKDVANSIGPKREWFQTTEEIRKQKRSQRLEPHKKSGKFDRNKRKPFNPEERRKAEMSKIVLLQARMVKKSAKLIASGHKPVEYESNDNKKRIKKGARSNFASDLINVSGQNVKKLRHEGNVAKREALKNMKDKNIGGRNGGNPHKGQKDFTRNKFNRDGGMRGNNKGFKSNFTGSGVKHKGKKKF